MKDESIGSGAAQANLADKVDYHSPIQKGHSLSLEQGVPTPKEM